MDEVNEVPNNKTRKAVTEKKSEERYIKTYNPTKSKAGRIILILLVAGMFLGMLIAAIYGMYVVLTS